MNFRRAFFQFFLLTLAARALAAPAITSTDYNGTPGSTMTITGTGFDATQTGKPFLWIDCDNGTCLPSTLGITSTYQGTDSVSATTTVHYTGHANAIGSTPGWRNTSVGANFRVNLGLNLGDKYFVYGKRYSTQTVYYNPASAGQNTKVLRVWGATVGVIPDWYIGTQPDGSSIWTAETTNTQTGVTRVYGPAAWAQFPASWHTWEYFVRNNSSVGTATGHIQIHKDNASYGFLDAFQMDDATHPGPLNLFVWEHTLANNSSGQWAPDGESYSANILIDTGTWAHAYLCDQATYAASTTCEILVPSARTTTTWTVKTDFGALTGNVYVYVCDNGATGSTCNANGFLLATASGGGGGGGGTTPVKAVIGGRLTINGGISFK